MLDEEILKRIIIEITKIFDTSKMRFSPRQKFINRIRKQKKIAHAKTA